METPNKLECVPAELRLIVSEHLRNIKTLSALVHAPPAFHAVYLKHRERILTRPALREPKSKTQTDQSFASVDMSEFVVRSNIINPSLRPTVEPAYARASAGKIDSVKPLVDQCLALGTVD